MRWTTNLKAENSSDLQKMPQGRALCQRMCPNKVNSAGKLDTLGMKGRACKGEPRKVCACNMDSIQFFPVNQTFANTVYGRVNSRMIRLILDTGAPVTLMRGDLWGKIAASETLQPWRGPPLVGEEGTPCTSSSGLC